MLGRAMVKNC